MKKKLFSVLSLALISTMGVTTVLAQETVKQDTVKVSAPKAGETTNVMLNASADNGPRDVNIGLPKSVGGTVILENGLPVTYDYMGQMPTAVWRQDNGISKFKVLNVSETALLASDVGVSVSTWSNRGTEKTKGAATFTTNSFGLLRGDVSISGPLKKGWYYSATAFLNFDPGTFNSNISQFLDKTQVYKGVINKKYAKGQIGLQYKYAYSESISTKQSPYIYRKDGSVDALPGFRIGRDSYLEQSGRIHTIDPLTGNAVDWDAMSSGGSTSHVFDLMGDHKFDNDMVLDYTVRYHYAKSGFYNPYLTSISTAASPSSTPNVGDKRYFYADNPDAPYTGYVQGGMMIFSPRTEKNTIMARFELSKKSEKHHWMVGFHNWFYDANKVTSATYNYQFEVAPNPKMLTYQEFDGTNWISKTDQYGTRNHNAALQYYNGMDNKMALVGSEKWEINKKLSLNAGARIEWQRVDGDWYSAADRAAAPNSTWLSGNTTDVKKDWWNLSGTANLTYKAFDNFGFLFDGYYLQQAGKLSAYAGADDPGIEKCEIPGFSAGVYFNHPMISLVSKFTKIERTNFKNNSTFNAMWQDAAYPGRTFSATTKQTSSYDVSTIGWTTDMLITPFKGFQLHLLLTLQNPKYKNYAMTINYADDKTVPGYTSTYSESVNNNGNVARSVSKTIIEIDPSYSFGKFKVWASARYFSKEYANYPNTLIFKDRWETFAGLNYKYDKNVDFSISAVNLLNQSGAQGSISGTNTTDAAGAQLLYDKPLVGTYIRPFTLEFKTKIKF
ncbi:TonB-dependent receptor [Dysgonomonas sp. 25]|uniref:TonB-dependent receptor n=1 Tax=Dysgonomonas sp. 25 TaxID=2302933 RepID=UPI0013D41978|nr:TonB-dependent receptor [Dysgonomonas sp. 25]NDV70150.1 TonB-dependent receptor [Dysgonomonas sp. 25]